MPIPLERRLPVGEIPWFSHRMTNSPWKDARNPKIDQLVDDHDFFELQRYVQHDMRGYTRYARAVKDEFSGLDPRTVNSETLKSYTNIVNALSEGNVGVVDGTGDFETQANLNESISFLQDGILQYSHPTVYMLTHAALKHNLPVGMTEIYNSQQLADDLLESNSKTIKLIRQANNRGKADVYAGAKPIRATAIEALRDKKWGDQLGVAGKFSELANRLDDFENGIRSGKVTHADIANYQKDIRSRYDRFRCRAYTNDMSSMSEFTGNLRFGWPKWVRGILAPLGDRMDFYVSQWTYRSNGNVESAELRNEDFPRNIARYYRNLIDKLGSDDLAYASLHVHIPIIVQGKPIGVELQVAPRAMAPMHHLAERVYKQESPGLENVAPELINQARGVANSIS